MAHAAEDPGRPGSIYIYIYIYIEIDPGRPGSTARDYYRPFVSQKKSKKGHIKDYRLSPQHIST
jgi:hypothetical protein